MNTSQLEHFSYNNSLVRKFAYATITWGTVGFLVGLLLALQLFIPELNAKLPWLTFGRNI